MNKNTFSKTERISSKKLIDAMFGGGSKSLSVFPLRAVFMPVEPNENCVVSILISVPKKRFRHAVQRNRIKRQIREAYRKNKHRLVESIGNRKQGLAIAFVYVSNEIIPSAELENKMIRLLALISEKAV